MNGYTDRNCRWAGIQDPFVVVNLQRLLWLWDQYLVKHTQTAGTANSQLLSFTKAIGKK